MNLTAFFDQWFYSKGFPKMKAAYEFQMAGNYVKLTFEQLQAKKTEGIPVFDLSLDIEVVDTEGTVHKNVAVFQNGTVTVHFYLKKGVKPQFIRIDPECKALFSLEFNPGEEILVATAKHAKDVRNRIWAYETLAKQASVSGLLKLEAAILEEKFYGVKAKGISLL